MTAPKRAFDTDYGRYYRHPKMAATVPSITNIKRQKNNPAINGAMVRKVSEYAADNWDKLTPLDRGERIQLIKGSQYAKNPASRIGDIVHAWVDGFIRTKESPWECEPIILQTGEEVYYKDAPITARRMWRQFEGFNAHYEPKFLDSEFTVWSHAHNYAGTGDWIAEIRGITVLADTKTGKGVYPDVGLQLAALAYADVVLTDDGDEIPMFKWDRLAVLHLRPTQSRLLPVVNPEACFQAFLGLKENLNWDVEFQDKIIVDSPPVKTDYKGV
jgi:hypothetical protein